MNINKVRVSLAEYQQSPKTLVILLGDARGGECTWDTLKRYVLDPMNADLALLFDHGPDEKSHPLFKMAQFHWCESVNFKKIWDDEANKAGIHNPAYEINPIDNLHGSFDGRKGSGGIIVAFRKVLMKYEETIRRYDRVILTRSDFFYQCDHPNVIPRPDEVFVPYGEEYGGYTDRHAVFAGQSLGKVVDILEFTIRSGVLYKNVESVLKAYWESQNISVTQFHRTNFSVKLEDDQTRWAKGSNKVWINSPGLRLKYPKEYDNAQNNCDIQPISCLAHQNMVQKRVALISKAITLEGEGLGVMIDSYDEVVRVNQAYDFPEELHKDYGSRTDTVYDTMNYESVVLLNKNWDPSSDKKLVCTRHVSDNIKRHLKDLNPDIKFRYSHDSVLRHDNNKPLIQTGILAAMDILMDSSVTELFIAGFDFYTNAETYTKSAIDKAKTVSPKFEKIVTQNKVMHDQKQQAAWFVKYVSSDPRVILHKKTEDALNLRLNE